MLDAVLRVRSQAPALAELEHLPEAEKLLPTGPHGGLPTAALLSKATPNPCRLWIRAAEDFVAMRETTFIYHVLNQVRLLVAFALLASLMVVCAVFAYALQPHRFVTVWSGTMLVISAAAALRVIVMMERNEVLSRLAQSAEGGSLLKLNLLNQVFTYVLLPIAVLAARVFPEFGDLLTSRVEPLLNLLQ